MAIIIDQRSTGSTRGKHPQVCTISFDISKLKTGIVENVLDWAVTRADDHLMLLVTDTTITVSYVGRGAQFNDLRGGPTGNPTNTDVTVTRLCDCPVDAVVCKLDVFEIYRLIMWQVVKWQQMLYDDPPVSAPVSSTSTFSATIGR